MRRPEDAPAKQEEIGYQLTMLLDVYETILHAQMVGNSTRARYVWGRIRLLADELMQEIV